MKEPLFSSWKRVTHPLCWSLRWSKGEGIFLSVLRLIEASLQTRSYIFSKLTNLIIFLPRTLANSNLNIIDVNYQIHLVNRQHRRIRPTNSLHRNLPNQTESHTHKTYYDYQDSSIPCPRLRTSDPIERARGGPVRVTEECSIPARVLLKLRTNETDATLPLRPPLRVTRAFRACAFFSFFGEDWKTTREPARGKRGRARWRENEWKKGCGGAERDTTISSIDVHLDVKSEISMGW